MVTDYIDAIARTCTQDARLLSEPVEDDDTPEGRKVAGHVREAVASLRCAAHNLERAAAVRSGELVMVGTVEIKGDRNGTFERWADAGEVDRG